MFLSDTTDKPIAAEAVNTDLT